jgi:regulator of RNase E activity RraB
MTDWPDDADGKALRHLAETGSDLGKPMDVDIQIAAPDEDRAIRIAEAAAGLGYRTEVFFDDDLEDVDNAAEPWTCECSRVMQLDYMTIVAVQRELDEIARPLGCYVDGWSTWGNADVEQA